MATLESKLLARREIADRTMAFEFEKPAGFQFTAGQAMEVKLIKPKETDAEGDSRAFSIASAPAAKNLEVATRLRDTAFKRTLKSMPIGTPVELDGPFGSMTLHKNAKKPAVFVAGGIGITPFMSILRQAAQERSTRSFVLLNSNRRPEDAPYLDELDSLAKSIKGMRLLATMVEAEKSSHPWSGRRGLITAAFVSESVPEIGEAICYTAGPPAMVAAMRKALLEAGADDDSIRTEDFQGY